MAKKLPLYPHVPKSRMQEREYELKVKELKVGGQVRTVIWVGSSGENAVERYADTHRGESVLAWREVPHGVFVGIKKIVEPGEVSYLKEYPLGTKKFPLGQLVFTRGVADKVADDTEFAKFVTLAIARHAIGDWGNLSQEDKNENESALKLGNRLLSAYERYSLPKIWIITESDRSITTVLFPEEY